MAENKEENKKSPVVQKEEEILKFWRENKIFEKTLEKTNGGKPFVFYDGPPFATGLPHYGHLLAGTIKDAIPRYQTMKGRFVRRKWGWDCHGLPIENLIESELNLAHKKDIEDLGVGKFNEAARASVLRYVSDWKEIIPRMGRFVDMKDGYKTMDTEYTESIWWAFKELFKKGLIYEGYKSMHICPRCETTLASSEVAQGYKDITDISVTAKFEILPDTNKLKANEAKSYLLAWTTTPWTLPGNVALAINKDINYVNARIMNKESGIKESYILAKDRINEVFKDIEYEIIEEIKGDELVGKKYKPLFDYYLSAGQSDSKNKNLENHENGWKIYSADFVTTESGTGIVHIAPAFGEDDMALGKKYDLPFIQHVGIDGRFKDEITDFAGEYVKPKENSQKTDIEIIKYLAHKNLLFSKEKIIHSYPHCWRCDTPLLNYAANSWFMKVTKIKEKMAKENKKVLWVPKTVGDNRFGNWIDGARDWAISRTRYWGAPLPVWKCGLCENIEVVGSIEDMRDKIVASNNEYFVVRHGQADHNARNIISSKENNSHHLTEKGKTQAIQAVENIKKKGEIDVVFASPFVRTRETTEIITGKLGIPKEKIIFDKRIGEIDISAFEGESPREYHKNFSSIEEKFIKKIDGVETLTEVRRRVMEFLYEIDRKYSDKKILIITHEYPTWMIFAGARGADNKESAKMKEGKDDFIKTGEVMSVDFSYIPHNNNYEVDLHRPYIDSVVLSCRCGGQMHRIPEVFDCWFESGSMPYAQFHYPFENKREFENNFPADFIAEGIDQTRGWFYTMLALCTGLFGKSPYNTVIVNGMVLAEDGAKMSKRLQNYPEPMDVVSKYGADAVRFYMLSSPIVHGEDLSFSEKAVDEVYKKNILRLQNVVTFYKTYDSALQKKPLGGRTSKWGSNSKNVLDRWILVRLDELVGEVSSAMDNYELDRATRPIAEFIDDLSTWYIRRSRDRFKSEDKNDKEQALLTTRYALLTFSKIIAPFMPFLAESVYKEAGGKKESVHLENWPKEETGILYNIFGIGKKDSVIIKEMKDVRRIVSLGLEARANVGIKVRQPLSSLGVKKAAGYKIQDTNLTELIKNEVNVKEVTFDEIIKNEVEIDTEITPELKKEGQVRELSRQIQDMRKKRELTPDDRISLKIKTNKEGEDLVKSFEDQIKKTVLADRIEFVVNEGEGINIDDISFTIKF